MTIEELKHLLQRASEATNEFACAIDTQLYRCGSYYNNAKEQAIRDLASELERAAQDVEDGKLEIFPNRSTLRE